MATTANSATTWQRLQTAARESGKDAATKALSAVVASLSTKEACSLPHARTSAAARRTALTSRTRPLQCSERAAVPGQIADLFHEQAAAGDGVAATGVLFRGAAPETEHGPRTRALLLKEALRRLGSDECTERQAAGLVAFFLPEVPPPGQAARAQRTVGIDSARVCALAADHGRASGCGCVRAGRSVTARQLSGALPHGRHSPLAGRRPQQRMRERRPARPAAQAALFGVDHRHHRDPALDRCADTRAAAGPCGRGRARRALF